MGAGVGEIDGAGVGGAGAGVLVEFEIAATVMPVMPTAFRLVANVAVILFACASLIAKVRGPTSVCGTVIL